MTRIVLYLLALGLFFTACRDTSVIGSGLLDEEKFDIQFEDDFDISTEVVNGERMITYRVISSGTINQSFFSLGTLDDPLFGKKTASIFTEIGLTETGIGPDFVGHILDSMVLVLRYDTLSRYGDTLGMHNLEVFSLSQDFTNVDTIYGDVVPEHVPFIIGTKQFVPNYVDSITIIDPVDTSDFKVPAQIRIRIKDSWANQLFTDSTLHESVASLRTFTKGFYITDNSETSSLIGLDLRSSANFNRLIAYYHESDGSAKTYSFPLSTRRGQIIMQDYSGSFAAQIQDGMVSSNDLFYTESQVGQDGKIVFNDIDKLRGKIINHAKLKVYVADNAIDDLRLYPPINQLVAQEDSKTEIGKRTTIRDVSDLQAVNAGLTEGFGGNLKKDSNGQYYYEFLITKKLMGMLDPIDPDEPFFYLVSFTKSQVPNRTLYYGGKSNVLPVKLEVTYTNN